MAAESKSRTPKTPGKLRSKNGAEPEQCPFKSVPNLTEDTPPYDAKLVRFIDLFCGIGGFHVAMKQACAELGLKSKAVFASDIDKDCQIAYEANFSLKVHGDITKIDEKEVPFHDVLVGGFPCQPFSIIGERKGFDDTRGTLFFDIARIIKEKQPAAFVLENVKTLRGHDGGQTLKLIIDTLEGLGYKTTYTVLNALNFGLPQKRERIWIVGNRLDMPISLPIGDQPMTPLSDILEKNVDIKHFASPYIRKKRHSVMKPGKEPTIWHENKAGNISSYPYSCALRAGASYNYLLVNGERRLTPREMLRLQGFPDSYKIVSTDSQSRKQAGNSLPVNVAKAVLKELFLSLQWGKVDLSPQSASPVLFSPVKSYNEKTKIKNC
ncbi:MAG: DNA cytosine methyltransferase [bacterium]